MGLEDIAGVISFRFEDSHLYVSELVCPAPELLLCARGFFSPASASALFGEPSRSCGRLSLQVVFEGGLFSGTTSGDLDATHLPKRVTF